MFCFYMSVCISFILKTYVWWHMALKSNLDYDLLYCEQTYLQTLFLRTQLCLCIMRFTKYLQSLSLQQINTNLFLRLLLSIIRDLSNLSHVYLRLNLSVNHFTVKKYLFSLYSYCLFWLRSKRKITCYKTNAYLFSFDFLTFSIFSFYCDCILRHRKHGNDLTSAPIDTLG